MRVSFVGAGPGDPRLLTLRGAELLGRADVVVVSAGVHEETVARAPAHAERWLVDRLAPAEKIAAEMISRAQSGKNVVRLFRGDSMLFGTGLMEVTLVSRAKVPIEIVAGVIVPTAAAAYAGLALSSSEDITPSVAFATVTDAAQLHDWKSLSLATDTLALLVDVAHLEEITTTLTYYGRSPETPAGLVQDPSLPTQRVAHDTLVRIRDHASKFAPGEVLLLVGKPLARRDGLRWFDTRPLFGKRVLLTRPREQGARTAAMLREFGADPVVMPTIEIGPPADVAALDHALGSLSTYDWIAFTSDNGVTHTWDRLAALGKDARAFGRAKIAAIGPATASALKAHGLSADVTAKEFRGEGLVDVMLAAMGADRGRVLVLRAKEAREVLPETLREKGCHVDVVAVYETHPVSVERIAAIAAALEHQIDAITFTSASTVTSLCDALGDRAAPLLAKVKVASIGPITTEAANSRGVRVDATATEHSLPGLMSVLVGLFDA